MANPTFYPNLKGQVPDKAEQAIRFLFDSVYKLQANQSSPTPTDNSAILAQLNSLSNQVQVISKQLADLTARVNAATSFPI